MKDLNDYTGPFDPKMKLEDLSKDALLKLLLSTNRTIYALDEHWLNLIKTKLGEEKALEIHDELWQKFGAVKGRQVAMPLGITGNDVAAAMKCYQMDPGIEAIFSREAEYDMKNHNHCILTVKSCRPLDYFERHNYSPEAISYICAHTDKAGTESYVRHFNPRIKVTALKVPPRQSPDEIACQWEFKLEE